MIVPGLGIYANLFASRKMAKGKSSPRKQSIATKLHLWSPSIEIQTTGGSALTSTTSGCRSPPPRYLSLCFPSLPVSFVPLILAYNKEYKNIQMQIVPEPWMGEGGAELTLKQKYKCRHFPLFFPDYNCTKMCFCRREREYALLSILKAYQIHNIM